MATIDAGSAKGVKVGMKLVVYRGKRFVGYLKIALVKEHLAGGYLVESVLVARCDDKVTTADAIGKAWAPAPLRYVRRRKPLTITWKQFMSITGYDPTWDESVELTGYDSRAMRRVHVRLRTWTYIKARTGVEVEGIRGNGIVVHVSERGFRALQGWSDRNGWETVPMRGGDDAGRLAALLEVRWRKFLEYMAEGKRLLAAGDPERAWISFECALVLDPDNVGAKRLRAQCKRATEVKRRIYTRENADDFGRIGKQIAGLRLDKAMDRARTLTREAKAKADLAAAIGQIRIARDILQKNESVYTPGELADKRRAVTRLEALVVAARAVWTEGADTESNDERGAMPRR